ncbi:MAG: S1C family serine protease [Planctomycetota bacterium]
MLRASACGRWPFVVLFGALFLSQTWGNSANGQRAVPAAMERFGPISAEKRAELRAQLERHAQVLEAQSAILKTVAKLIGPSVVHIEADVSSRSRRGREIEEAGSGVIVDFRGRRYVLTNRHVIRDADPGGIKINLADGRRLYPDRVWQDAESDVAVLSVDAPDLIPAPLADSDHLEIGDFVLAVGSPFGLSHSVTYGIISAKGRRDLRLGEAELRFQDFLQTDAAINPGNSGGPLVNLRGEVVGINTAIASSSGGNEGIGFSIPINMFIFVARQLVETGQVTRAYLGVSLNSRFGPAMAAELGLPSAMGAHVSMVTANSPAAAAGVRVGDVVLEYNHVRVEDDAHLVNLVSYSQVGSTLPLVVFRDGKMLTLEVRVGTRPAPPPPPASE